MHKLINEMETRYFLKPSFFPSIKTRASIQHLLRWSSVSSHLLDNWQFSDNQHINLRDISLSKHQCDSVGKLHCQMERQANMKYESDFGFFFPSFSEKRKAKAHLCFIRKNE